MFYELYQFVHSSLGLCFWDLPALFVGVVMIIVILVHKHNQNEREKDFEKELDEKLHAVCGTEECAEASFGD